MVDGFDSDGLNGERRGGPRAAGGHRRREAVPLSFPSPFGRKARGVSVRFFHFLWQPQLEDVRIGPAGLPARSIPLGVYRPGQRKVARRGKREPASRQRAVRWGTAPQSRGRNLRRKPPTHRFVTKGLRG